MTKSTLCPGCSGHGVMTDDPQVSKCESCGGFFTPAEPITVDQAEQFVRLHLPMLANAGGDGQYYFDLDILTRNGERVHERYHGWADRKTKRVTQWG